MKVRQVAKRERAQVYKMVDGRPVRVSPSEIKLTIMRAHGWTEEEYIKKRDLFRNRLRNYEAFRKEQGIEEKPQNVTEVLYKQAKTMLREGSFYRPSKKLQMIESFSAVSITKGREQAKREGLAFKRQNLAHLQYVYNRFSGLIRDNKGIQNIITAFENDAIAKG